MGDRPGFWVVRLWMLQCIGVVDTRGEDCRFRGEQRAWLSPHRVLSATGHLQWQSGPDQAVHCWTAMGGSGVIRNRCMHECRWSLQLTDRERFLLGAQDQG